jgi:quinoprotein glucose dehydrogenase
LLEDHDANGQADASFVFADGFNQVVEGTGAGVLAIDSVVYYTCIPNLWLLEDTDGDRRADAQTSLHEGFGVRVAFRGHDLHGLIVGPDGRLYFSVGDRGFNVQTPEGKHLLRPDTGAVFRCQLDGSQLEVYAYGMRNPQELAFDNYGNLFTGDNNSDSGDRARWVYVVQGGDSGWRMYYQYLRDRGPWNRERLWDPHHDGQAAYIVPPIAHLGDGPSGLVHYPGLGLSDRYADHFFLCDFRGAAPQSGVRSFAVEPQGASFQLVDSHQFLWSILATDVDFGWDGTVYVSDWVHGWDGLGKGRIYAFHDPRYLAGDVALRIRQGFEELPSDQLVTLLGHADQRVRLQAQFQLAARKEQQVLVQASRSAENRLARLHAIWGLGQLGQRDAALMAPVIELLGDADSEVRAQAAKVLGDGKLLQSARPALIAALADPEPRVRFFAALSLTRYPGADLIGPLLALVADNQDRDPMLRHAAVMALAALDKDQLAAQEVQGLAPSVSRALAVALRRQENVGVAQLLRSSDLQTVVEAARAIHDLPITEGMESLAKLADGPWYFGDGPTADALGRRIINANFRLGTVAALQRLAHLALDPQLPRPLTAEILWALENWASPPHLDRVLGDHRPLPERSTDELRSAMIRRVPLLMTLPDRLIPQVTELAEQYGITQLGPELMQMVQDQQRSGATRAAALEAIARLKLGDWQDRVRTAASSERTELRMKAHGLLVDFDPPMALQALARALTEGEPAERQQAIRLLARIDSRESTRMLRDSVQRLIHGEIPDEIQLDVLEAAEARAADDPQLRQLLDQYQASLPTDDPLAGYRVCLTGGDAVQGERVFLEISELSCRRCHNVEGTEVSVGPNLAGIGSRQSRAYLLEAIVAPNQTIAEGFRSTIVVTVDGKIITGIVRQQDEQAIEMVLDTGELIRVPREEIEEQLEGKSAMPEDLVKQVSKKDLRDLVEYLSSLRDAPGAP